jgi:hypothetical protein
VALLVPSLLLLFRVFKSVSDPTRSMGSDSVT